MRITLAFRGSEDFSWILIKLKCNTTQNNTFLREHPVMFGSNWTNFAEHNASGFSFCGWWKVKQQVGSWMLHLKLIYIQNSLDVMVIWDNLMAAEMDPWS